MFISWTNVLIFELFLFCHLLIALQCNIIQTCRLQLYLRKSCFIIDILILQSVLCFYFYENLKKLMIYKNYITIIRVYIYLHKITIFQFMHYNNNLQEILYIFKKNYVPITIFPLIYLIWPKSIIFVLWWFRH